MRTRINLVVAMAAALGCWTLSSGLTLAAAPATRPALEAADYGQRLSDQDGVVIWWCDATEKISRTRPVPEGIGEAAYLEAARNEFEAVQVVIRPAKVITDLKCTSSDLRGIDDSRIPADRIQILRVGYVTVTAPTDEVGHPGDWPDPLPPLDRPIEIPAGVNQPLWVLIHVPKAAKPGEYTGQLELSAKGWTAKVPLRLRVWDFTLPDTPRTVSAFGLDMGTVFKYQLVQNEADKRAVFAKYMQSFADHRISPYDPTPFDDIQFKFLPDAEPPRVEVNFERFDAAMRQAIDQWHITSFRLTIPGMGGGTFHARQEGELAGYKAGTPKYDAMFASMVKQLEAHLREKGWLNLAYVYWFDEPQPRDYEFVRAGMDRIHKYAPGIRRMLTEQPAEPLFGAVDLWCPISNQFNLEAAKARQAVGERFWWYVCTGPKAPYCTLFIDHPSTDLRAWLWQTWQRGIDGVLIWSTTYWTSSTAFPDSLQNPYADPMAYTSGYGTPPGTKRHWGNGDGRFLYPPVAAAEGSAAPNLDGPVSCIRWEILREGIEDLDYLHLLADAAQRVSSPELRAQANQLLQVPEEITTDAKHYTYHPRPIYIWRHALGEMIEKLGRAEAK